MQRFFFDKSSHAFIPSGVSIVKKIKRIQEIFFKLSMPVIHTAHINTEKDAKQMGRWWRDIVKREDEFSEIIDGEPTEVTIPLYGKGKIVLRPMVLDDMLFTLVVRIPHGKFYKRFLSRMEKDIRSFLKGA